MWKELKIRSIPVFSRTNGLTVHYFKDFTTNNYYKCYEQHWKLLSNAYSVRQHDPVLKIAFIHKLSHCHPNVPETECVDMLCLIYSKMGMFMCVHMHTYTHICMCMCISVSICRWKIWAFREVSQSTNWEHIMSLILKNISFSWQGLIYNLECSSISSALPEPENYWQEGLPVLRYCFSKGCASKPDVIICDYSVI